MPMAWRERPMLELRGEDSRKGDDLMLCMSFITLNSVFHLFSHLQLIITAVLSKILFPLYEHYVYSLKLYILYIYEVVWGTL